MNEWTSLKDFLTIGAAVLGAALGIMNTWNAMSQRRVRLQVRPANAMMMPEGRISSCIKVTNLSTFPLTITEVGFTDTTRNINQRRIAVVDPILIDGKPWPRRLEPRDSVSVFFNPDLAALQSKQIKIGKAYVYKRWLPLFGQFSSLAKTEKYC